MMKRGERLEPRVPRYPSLPAGAEFISAAVFNGVLFAATSDGVFMWDDDGDQWLEVRPVPREDDGA